MAVQAEVPEERTLATAIEAITGAAPVDQVHWGILAVHAGNGEVLYARNQALKFIPASNMKLPVAAAGLRLLGRDHRWTTAFHAGGDVEDGVLQGPLLLPAQGDPSLGRPFRPSADEALRKLTDSLRAAGVERVRGPLVVDVSAWDSVSVPPTWMVGNLDARYGATGGAFTVGAGEVRVVVSGGTSAEEPARVRWRPVGHEAFVRSEVLTGEEDAPTELRTTYWPESRRLVVSGTIAPNRTDTLEIAVRDPVRQSGRALYRALAEGGVVVEGGLRFEWERDRPIAPGCVAGRITECRRAPPIASLASPPMSEVVRVILEPSHNWVAEQLVRTLGRERGEEGSWQEGFEAMSEFLERDVGVDTLDVNFEDGSGLSAYNLLTPRSIVRILSHMARSPEADAFRTAMAEPGKEDTTLESRLTDLEGRLFAKTGTIRNVNALSGYLADRKGEEILFSILTNGSGLPAEVVRDAMDEVVRALAGEGAEVVADGER